MKLKHIFLLSFILMACSTRLSYAYTTSISISQNTYDDIITHTVAKGETVYSIAAAYQTTVQQIYKLNPKAEQGIKAGDKLQIRKVRAIASYSNHLIEAKETLFSVSRMYKISVDDVKDANPGLTESTFSIGKTIKIPVFNEPVPSAYQSGSNTMRSNIEYKVQKGETLYSIGKANNTTVEALLNANPSLKNGGLKDGMTIIIPSGQAANNVSGTEYIPTSMDTPSAAKGETVRVGILLPFTDNGGSIAKDKLTEYYEGFLLAVKDMKSKGLNAEIYTFDTGPEKNTKRLESLMETNEMNNLHLIIGGVSKQQIDALVKFSKKTGIKYVIPFGSSSEINNDPLLFQMTSSHSSLYPEVVSAFVKRFSNYNIIFVSEAGSNNDKMDFVNELKKGLSKSAIQSKTITNSNNLLNDLKNALNATKENIIIPTSSTEVTLRRITASVNLITGNSITLFGYPEWQTYSAQVANLHKYNSYIYSIFFVDGEQSGVKDFAGQYKQWYNKNLINSFPKWGYLGYDTGLYFLTALKQYGSSFDNNISRINVPTLQSSISFEKVNDKNGGFVNNGIYFIRYKENSGLEKISITD
ncbi:LysM peptidoglycan-binding domain-containing protein [Dysgonomonas sp. 521]|uniref:amino acid ABC transporter substrate-binding protein n=1 Tax=Dysgonomonas sp. 521 TaxID=2302932 RepID=UPI0013D0EB52|nr:LysM peptidoglycan-binding domain-containing protein [Dysgonomonas sp. 521]NDV95599.1 LysM peptidoglycan-binding domain-containing protein [Dysgonomonas sp. 521]